MKNGKRERRRGVKEREEEAKEGVKHGKRKRRGWLRGKEFARRFKRTLSVCAGALGDAPKRRRFIATRVQKIRSRRALDPIIIFSAQMESCVKFPTLPF